MLLSLDYSRVVAALEDRIQFLVKKFPSVTEESIRFLSKCDPANGKYLEYLVSQKAKRNLFGRDDNITCMGVKYTLSFYMMVTQSKRVKEHLQEIFPELDVPNEISQISYGSLFKLAGEYRDDAESVINKLKKGKKHSKVIYQDDTYKIIVFTWDPLMNWDDLVAEVCAYGKGKWCTQHKDKAEEYLEGSGGLYIVFKDGKSILQTDGVEFKDVYNNNFDFSKYPDLAIILIKTGIIRLDKKTPSDPYPNLAFLDKLNYYMNLLQTASVRQYLKENNFM
jgi:hypothetical protein